MNVIKKLWRGEYTLAGAYWGFYVLPSFVFRMIQSMMQTLGQKPKIFLLVILVYSIFIAVAVWRSANNYKGRKIWSFLAKLIMVLNVLLSLVACYHVFIH